MDKDKKKNAKEPCFCEKGIIPEKDLRTEFRCPQCGKVGWPGESKQK